MSPRIVVVEADGGSRGNPGPAAYGAVLKDKHSGAVLAEDGRTIGVATNNVAEYRGLLAGLALAAEFAPDADIEVRMDSKLVVEQMAGRWKVKHPAMVPLAAEAKQLAPVGTTYTWIPRAKNAHADRLANQALDGRRSGVTTGTAAPSRSLATEPAEPAEPAESTGPVTLATTPPRGWAPGEGTPTTLILVRHGETPHTREKRFSSGLTGSDPGLSDEGRAQVRATADWLAGLGDQVVLVASPVRRTAESAAIVAERLGVDTVVDEAFAEMDFGHWDGLTFAETARRHPEELTAWTGSTDVPAGGGESLQDAAGRVRAGLERLLVAHPGRTVVVVTHVTPIKTLVTEAMGVELGAMFRMELAPASVTVVAFWPPGEDGTRGSSLRLFNARSEAGL